MIPRYKNSSIAKIWSKESTLDRWLLVEMSHLKAMLNEGVIGKEEYQKVATSVVIDKRRSPFSACCYDYKKWRGAYNGGGDWK